MNHKLLLCLVIAVLCLCVSTVAAQEVQPADVIKINSNLVSVPVIVSDTQGRYISGLAAEKFTLYDNSVVQRIAFFDAAEEPLNVALLLDTSRSTQGVLDEIRKAAKNFLKELRPQDRAMIVSFDFAVHRLSPLTSDRKVLENAIKQTEVGEFLGTTLNDAVFEIAEKDFKPITGRKAIILLTDGQDRGSQVSEAELLASQAESDTMVYSIFFASDLDRDFRGLRDRPFPFPGRRGGRGRGGRGGRGGMGRRNPIFNQFPRQRPDGDQRRERQSQRDEWGAEFLMELSEVTAGRFYRSDKTDLKKTFALIAEELRFQYRLAFQPEGLQNDDRLHELRVTVDAPNVIVRARRQYRAPPK